MKLFFALLAFASGATANPWGWNVAPQPIQDLPDVAAARAAHLAEHARQTGAALVGRPWAVPVAVQLVGGRASSAAEVAAARAAHLAEVARISGERLGALNAALARAGQVAVAATPALAGAPQPIQDNADVAAARAAHLAEVARQNGAALGALAAANARNLGIHNNPLWAVKG